MKPPKTPNDVYPLTFATGVVVGLVLGSALALWYAPRSGKQTVDDVKQVVSRTQDRWQGETIDQALAEGRALAHQYRAKRA